MPKVAKRKRNEALRDQATKKRKAAAKKKKKDKCPHCNFASSKKSDLERHITAGWRICLMVGICE